MPRNSKGGKKFKRTKKFTAGIKNREMVYKQPEQLYAILEKNHGNLVFDCTCDDNKGRRAVVAGSFRKRVWFREGDVVLVSIRSFEPHKCDILYKYNPAEIEILKNQNLFNYLLDKQPEDMEELVESESESDDESEDESEDEDKPKIHKKNKISNDEIDAI